MSAQVFACFTAASRTDLVHALADLASGLRENAVVGTVGPGVLSLELDPDAEPCSPFPVVAYMGCCHDQRTYRSEADLSSLSERCACGENYFVLYGAPA